MDQQIKDWQTEVELTYYEHINTVPLIHKGSTPFKDVEVVKRLSHRRIVWFYYDIDRIPTDLWSLFLLKFMFSKEYDVQLTTAIDLSDRLGIPHKERNIPALWILSVEYLVI